MLVVILSLRSILSTSWGGKPRENETHLNTSQPLVGGCGGQRTSQRTTILYLGINHGTAAAKQREHPKKLDKCLRISPSSQGIPGKTPPSDTAMVIAALPPGRSTARPVFSGTGARQTGSRFRGTPIEGLIAGSLFLRGSGWFTGSWHQTERCDGERGGAGTSLMYCSLVEMGEGGKWRAYLVIPIVT